MTKYSDVFKKRLAGERRKLATDRFPKLEAISTDLLDNYIDIAIERVDQYLGRDDFNEPIAHIEYIIISIAYQLWIEDREDGHIIVSESSGGVSQSYKVPEMNHILDLLQQISDYRRVNVGGINNA